MLIQDLRYAIRTLLKSPSFTLVAIMTLGLGIGASTAIFSVVSAVLLKPLPYSNPEQLTWICETNLASGVNEEAASLPDFTDWQAQSHSFEEMATFTNTAVVLTGTGEPERYPAVFVSYNFFTTLGVSPANGRAFIPEENIPGRHRVVILSDSIWKSRFGGDPELIGKTITLNGNPHSVIGVMPRGFKHPDPAGLRVPELWLAQGIDPAQAPRRADFLSVIGRL